MGVDLQLLPLDHWTGPGNYNKGWGYSHTVLPVPRWSDAWPDFSDMPQTEIGDADISSYVGGSVPDGSSEGETMYGRLVRDAYGCAYKMARAGDLVVLLKKWWPKHPTTAYIAAMSPSTFVVLNWH